MKWAPKGFGWLPVADGSRSPGDGVRHEGSHLRGRHQAVSPLGFLARDGWKVPVVDQANGLRQQGYMIDFFGHGWQAAASLGVLPRLRMGLILIDMPAIEKRLAQWRAVVGRGRESRSAGDQC